MATAARAGPAREPGLRPVDRSRGDALGPPRRRHRGAAPSRRPPHHPQQGRRPALRADRAQYGKAARTRRRSAPGSTARPRSCAAWFRTAGAVGFLRRELHAGGLVPGGTPAPCTCSEPRPRGVRPRSSGSSASRSRSRPPRGPHGRRRLAGVAPGGRGAARHAAPGRGGRAAAAAGRSPPRLPRRPGERPRLRGEGGRVHPDHRRPGQAVPDFLAFNRPKLEDGVERGLHATTTRRLMGRRTQAGPVPQELRRRHGPAGRGHPGHGRPPRQLRARLHPKYYEDLGYPGHINCSENFNGEVTPYGVANARAGRPSTCSTTPPSTRTTSSSPTSPGRGRGTTCCSRRPTTCCAPHRPVPTTSTGQRLGDHRYPRPRLPSRETVLAGDRPSRHPGGRARHDQRDRVPLPHLGADPEHGRVPRLLAPRLLPAGEESSPSTGPAARRRRSWTCRRFASGRCSAPTRSS